MDGKCQSQRDIMHYRIRPHPIKLLKLNALWFLNGKRIMLKVIGYEILSFIWKKRIQRWITEFHLNDSALK